MDSLAAGQTTCSFGLLHFNLLPTRDALLPHVVDLYGGLMAGLTGRPRKHATAGPGWRLEGQKNIEQKESLKGDTEAEAETPCRQSRT